ncbi:MAG: PolC-type DNA polymerase III [Oscillospiraceae bacterium]|nr:PolC-type DNA polymerase III [Oscillospiraceae bacterium]
MTARNFSEIFPHCVPPEYDFDPLVQSVYMHQAQKEMTIELDRPPPSGWAAEAKRLICRYFVLSGVKIIQSQAEGMSGPGIKQGIGQMPVPASAAGAVLVGKSVQSAIMPIDKLPNASKKVCVSGRVFMVDKLWEPRNGTQSGKYAPKSSLKFYITDNHGAICVKYARLKNEFPKGLESELKKVFKDNGWVTVQGKLEPECRRFGDSDGQEQEWILLASCIFKSPPPHTRQDNAPQKRVELHLHTRMSEKDALTPIDEAVAQAARWGHSALAITDHGVAYAFPDAMKAGKKHGIKIIYGCEGYLQNIEGKGAFPHIILLARNEIGIKNLYKLISLAHIKYFFRRPLIPHDILAKHREGLIVGSACERGELFTALRSGKSEEELREIAQRYDYLEIQPLCNNMFLVRNGIAEGEEQLRTWNREIVRLAKELGKPVCATGDVHFLDPENSIYRQVLHAAYDDNYPVPLYFKTTDEMLSEFSYLGKESAFDVVVANPKKIADMCENISPVKSGEFFPKLEGSADNLRSLAYQNAHALYGEALPEIIEKRLKTELDAIIGKGYDVIYVIAQKLVERSLAEGYLVGSRGSVGSSIAAYFAGITEVNALPPHYRCPQCLASEFTEDLQGIGCGADMPEKNCPGCNAKYQRDGFDIPFYTFLGFDADKTPDIDLNFSGDYQERAHAHTVELFGKKNVYRAGTINTMKEKTALGYAKKYAEKENVSLSYAQELCFAKGCEGIRVTTGQHPGGLIIVPHENEIYEFCPVQFPANKKDSMRCTHFDYHAIDENLLKLDLLAHTAPTILRYLEDMTRIKAQDVPLDDRDTMGIFTSTQPLGFTGNRLLGNIGSLAVPEFGTKPTISKLEKTKPSTFDELVRISGLSHGEGVWEGNAEDLVMSKTASLGQVICARDDITLFLISKGLPGKLSFNISESVRKGKGVTPEWEQEMKKSGIPDWYIESCKKIKYMFPKAHAVAYVISGVKIAWFKVHHPAAFYAAWFSVNADAFDYTMCNQEPEHIAKAIRAIEADRAASATEQDKALVMKVVYEMLIREIPLLPFDIYTAHPTRFIAAGHGISAPLISAPGLGETAAQSIASEREKAPFLAVSDLLARTKANQANIDSLKRCGALGNMPESTQTTLF